MTYGDFGLLLNIKISGDTSVYYIITVALHPCMHGPFVCMTTINFHSNLIGIVQ